jgi:hypothetical protein
LGDFQEDAEETENGDRGFATAQKKRVAVAVAPAHGAPLNKNTLLSWSSTRQDDEEMNRRGKTLF